MSDRMYPLSMTRLINWITGEAQAQESIFGIPVNAIYHPKNGSRFLVNGEALDNPVGPAAGPHTQMANNIITAYLAGGRFMELKTVQILDELVVEKPCIDAQDEGYNVEWSQELKLEQAFDEYLKAWYLLHLLKPFIAPNTSERGYIFNMSAGYNLEGIKSERVDRFIRQMSNASLDPTFEQYRTALIEAIKADKFDSLKKLFGSSISNQKSINTIESVPAEIANSMTLSTMHGCPAHEIESIAAYLLTEKKLHTFVKLNPTLLGYNFVRGALDKLGYHNVELDPHGFEKDLSYKDAVPMIQRLQALAEKNNRNFGIKLSNTLAVKNNDDTLPGAEKYLSGRALFPLTINLASQISDSLNGNIQISYSGGITVWNIEQVLNTGIFPITLATDLLKPGGYGRLKALAEQTESIEVKTVIDLLALKQIADDAVNGKEYHKEKREINSIKVPLQLPVTDCYMAPCTAACPVHQDVADYISLVQQGRETEALALILDKNALPHITGFICDHQCMYHCTRWDYDEPVLIRDIKKHAALTAYDDLITQLNSIKKANGNTIKAAVIGAGPSGLSAAYYLAVNGFDVTVFEKEKTAGGIIRNVIPQFRIPEEVIEKDIDLIRQVGVDFYFGVNPNFSIETLKADGFKYIYVAIGAGKANELELDPCDSQVRNAIPFLREFHGDPNIELGRRVAIVGGGNSAMDAARAALRCKGVEKVYILYRRTKEQMPADKEEYDLAIADGVEFRELLLPVSHTNGIALCQKMRLGTAGPDGRRNVEAIPDDFISIEINTIIAAIGEKVDERLLNANNIHKLDRSLGATNLENVYIGGDAKRGPSTVIESAADGRNIAKLITEKESQVFQTLLQKYPELNSEARIKNSLQKKSKLDHQRQNIIDETDRCLTCHLICNKCVEVCPNRANLALTINDDAAYFKDAFQIIHFDDLCNECGNCATFCPYEGAPYKEKFTIFSSIELMKDSHNSGFSINHEKNLLSVRLHRSAEILQYQLNDGWEKKLEEKADGGKFSAMIKSIQKRYQYQL